MKIAYDAQVDAVSIRFHDTRVTTRDLVDGVVAELDADGKMVGIEILDATNKPVPPRLSKILGDAQKKIPQGKSVPHAKFWAEMNSLPVRKPKGKY